MLVGSRVIEHGSNYKGILLCYEKFLPITFTIDGPRNKKAFEKKCWCDYDSETIEFSIPEMGNYTIRARRNDVSIAEPVNIFVVPKQLFIYIQTDKAFYRPGERVKLRVIVLDRNMRPHLNYNN